MARLVVCSASQICQASGKRALATNTSRIPEERETENCFHHPAENVRASSALKVPTAAQAARLQVSMAAKNWPGGATSDPSYRTG